MQGADNVNRSYFAHYVQQVAAPGAVVLDYGCGYGTVVELLRAAGYDAYGVDIRWPGAATIPISRRAISGARACCGTTRRVARFRSTTTCSTSSSATWSSSMSSRSKPPSERSSACSGAAV